MKCLVTGIAFVCFWSRIRYWRSSVIEEIFIYKNIFIFKILFKSLK